MSTCKLCTLSVSLFLMGHSATFLRAQDGARPAEANPAKATDLRSSLLGAWALAGEPDSKSDPEPGARMKFWGLKHWVITQANPATGEVIFHHGGTYTLNDDSYEETFTFANQNTKHMIGTKLKFKIKVDGDTYTQIGNGNPYSERWVRLKDE